MVPRPRLGGRSSVVREAVLGAARDQLVDTGYSSLSLSSVARRAGVAVSTVSRRWPQTSDLLADVIVDSVTAPIAETPDTGTVVEDLRSIAVGTVRSLEGGRRVLLRSLLALPEPKFDSVRRTIWESQTAPASTVVRRATARGELPWEVEPQQLADLMTGAIWMAELVVGAPVEEQWLKELAASAVLVARIGAVPSPSGPSTMTLRCPAVGPGHGPERALRPFEQVGIALAEIPQQAVVSGRSVLLDAAARELTGVGFEAITMTGSLVPLALQTARCVAVGQRRRR